MKLKELISLMFFISDEDSHGEFEESQKKKNGHRMSKALKQSFAEEMRELTNILDEKVIKMGKASD